VIEALGVGPVVGIGSSLGGAICQEWALKYPEDLTGLVLSSTWAEIDPYLDTLMSLWRRLVEGGRTEELMDSLLLYCFSGKYLRDNPGVIDEFRSAPIPDLTGFGAMTVACAAHDTVDRLGDIDIPTLVVIGTRDILIRPELSKRLAAGIPGAVMVEIDASPMTFWEQPDAWIAAVSGWAAAAAR
jgi:3-oxoadipate enol-lactonase